MSEAMTNKTIKVRDISVKGRQFVEIDKHRLPKLPYPYHDWVDPDIQNVKGRIQALRSLST